MTQFTLNLAPEKKVWTVSELTARIRSLLEPALQNLWVEGEISNLRLAQSGHLYFTLKDAKAQVRCVAFRNQMRLLKFRPEDGLHVTVRGSVGLYEQRGEYQIYVETIEPVGLGALQLAFEQLKKRLEAEGLFDPTRKKPLPMLPRRIGVVTSPSGAALRDVLRILRQRFPNVRILVCPVRVQGEGAADEIVDMLRFLNLKKLVDVILLVRGGGSLEDLWAFNEESLARALSASQIPIVSGVGHETDFTIADFVADVRASTPSNAAELVVRTRHEFDRHIAQLQQQLAQRIRYRLLELRHNVQALARAPAFRQPVEMVRTYRLHLDDLGARVGSALWDRLQAARKHLTRAHTRFASIDLRARIGRLRLRSEQRATALKSRMDRLLVAKRRRLDGLMLKLDERSPLRILERGYALVFDSAGNLVRSADNVAVGDDVSIRFARGRLSAEIKGKNSR